MKIKQNRTKNNRFKGLVFLMNCTKIALFPIYFLEKRELLKNAFKVYLLVIKLTSLGLFLSVFKEKTATT
jgi:hypothetical protein